MNSGKMDTDATKSQDATPSINDKISFFLEACPQISAAEAKKCLEAWGGDLEQALTDMVGGLGCGVGSSSSSMQPSSSTLPWGYRGKPKFKFFADIEDLDQRVMAEEILNLLPEIPHWKIILATERHKDKDAAVNMILTKDEARSTIKIERTDEGLPYTMAQNKLQFSNDVGSSSTKRVESMGSSRRSNDTRGSSATTSEEDSIKFSPALNDIYEISDSEDDDIDNDAGYFSDAEAAHLAMIFPHATYQDCKTELNLSERNMEEAIGAMREQLAEKQAIDGGEGIQNSKTKGKQLTNGKRLGENLESEMPGKRARSDEWADQTSLGLEDAGSWVRTYCDQTGQVRVILDAGEHPCRFTVPMLKNIFKYRDTLAEVVKEADPSITIPDVRLEIFDMAMQFSVCKRLQIRKRAKASENINVILEFIGFAEQTGLHVNLEGAASGVLAQVKDILVRDRSALIDAHVRNIYKIFPLGHPICDLFVKATVRPWMEFRYTDEVGDHNGDSEESDPEGGWRDAAHKAAFGKEVFPLGKLLTGKNPITAFQTDFFVMLNKIWFNRRVVDKNRFSRKKAENQVQAKDPLTEEWFIVV